MSDTYTAGYCLRCGKEYARMGDAWTPLCNDCIKADEKKKGMKTLEKFT